MKLIENMKWRYATKSFNPDKIVSDNDIKLLKEAVRLTPTSYGLQPFKVLIITDKSLKKELLPFTYNQKQVVEASHLFVFTNFTKISAEYLKHVFQLKAKIQGKPYSEFENYTNRLIDIFEKKSTEEIKEYTAYQTYMALETLLLAAAELKIDTCAIGGFMPEKYNEILDLDKQNLNATVIAAVGYRSAKDKNQFLTKFRLPEEELFFEV